MTDLPKIDPMAVVREALGHLDCAIGQTVPSDDRIIVEHMASAAALLRVLTRAK